MNINVPLFYNKTVFISNADFARMVFILISQTA